MKKVILFDLDDTLAPEDDFIRSGYAETARYLKDRYFPGYDEEKIKEELYALYKESPRFVFNRYLEGKNTAYTGEDIKELIRIYREHEPSVSYYDDVMPSLKELKELGFKLGIITDGFVISQRNKLKALDAFSFFDRIIITGELGEGYGKPDERPFIMMKEAFCAELSDLVYVGDNPEKDFYIGKDKEISTIRIYRKGSVYENAGYREDIREDIRIGSFDELLSAVKRL
ncbi:MAG: HAD-IA family hydrolase [Lachnospiraceae bacterium]|nr:HAD-IA family hydrolase [Lachnospiraceae bacterium]